MSSKIKSLIVWLVVIVAVCGAGATLFATGIVNIILGKEYSITFVVDGKEYVKKVAYGKMPEFDGNPEKEGDNTTEYVFECWEPEIKKAKKDATYTAKFSEQERLYEISVSSNMQGAADFDGAGKIYKYEQSATLSCKNVKVGYVFDGWYIGEDKIGSELNLAIKKVTKNLDIEARFAVITKTITYQNEKSVQNPNKKIYDIRDGIIQLQPLEKNGYSFVGWFTDEVGGDKIEEIDASTLENYVLYAHWNVVTYSITYSLNGGTILVPNPETYTVESGVISLNNPNKDGATFLGWACEIFEEPKTSATIPAGTFGELVFVAVWDDLKYSITFVVDGQELGEKQDVYYGANTTFPNIDSAKYGMGGYVIDGWYVNSDKTSKFVFGNILEQDTTVYGFWGDYFLDSSFCKYIEKFNMANAIRPIEIESKEELVAWTDYVRFYNIKQNLLISYGGFSGQELVDEMSDAARESKFLFSGEFAFSASGTRGSVYVRTSSVETDAAKKSTDVIDYSGLYTQQDYAPELTSTTRTKALNIDKLSGRDISNVSTTNQLYYCLELGYKPICVPGSIAEQVYSAARNIVSEITDDDMSDVQKLEAIYEWLILNVKYDNYAADRLADSWTQYRSWYAEGAILDHVAVCDGFSKAFVIMAQIENIPCVRETGNKHAWNKVYVNGNWFGIDATHGNLGMSGNSMEVVSYTSFLFTDAYKTGCGYTGTEHADLVADTLFNAYYNDGTTSDTEKMDSEKIVDHTINSKEELVLLLNLYKNFELSSESTYFTLEVVVAQGVSFSVVSSYAAIHADVRIAMTNDYEHHPMTDSLGQIVYVLFLQKRAH